MAASYFQQMFLFESLNVTLQCSIWDGKGRVIYINIYYRTEILINYTLHTCFLHIPTRSSYLYLMFGMHRECTTSGRSPTFVTTTLPSARKVQVTQR